MAKLAKTLLDISAKIPTDLPWVLRVDGHTDKVPISTAQFPSNWELSTARAISVVKFLISQGIPAERLAAAGFGEFQPLVDGRSEEHTSELQSLMRISYAVFCLKKTKNKTITHTHTT